MKRIAVAVLLLALLGVAACADDEPEPAVVEVPPWAKVAPEQIAEAKKHGVPVAFENDLGMRFVLIPAGTFGMGSPENEAERWHSETRHQVTITRPFYIQTAETTNEQYRRFRPDHDSGTFQYSRHTNEYSLNGDQQPAGRVSWVDVAEFAAWASTVDGGRTYRLPTEAEWERACRAGTNTAYGYGETLSAKQAKFWPDDETRRGMHVASSVDVRSYPPNAWGLYDMHGNVWEWCFDRYDGDLGDQPATDPTGASTCAGCPRVLRGGSWGQRVSTARSSQRSRYNPTAREGGKGFRLVCAVPAGEEIQRVATAKTIADCLAADARIGEISGRLMSDLMFKGGHRPEGWERLVEVWHSSFEERKEWANLAAGASNELNGLAAEAVRRNRPMTDGEVAAARSSVEAARELAATGEALQNKVDEERRAAR